MTDQQKAEHESYCAQWRAPVGTAVDVTNDDGNVMRTKTRSLPWMLGDRAVILVEGISGGYLLTRVKVVHDG